MTREIKYKPTTPRWKVPWRCKLFGHDFKDTEYTVKAMGFLDQTLSVCPKCGGGCAHVFPQGTVYLTPSAVDAWINEWEKLNAEKPKAEGNLVPFGAPDETR